jgi:hypothetical protein
MALTHRVGLLCMSNRLVIETSNWQHTTHARDMRPCPGGIRTFSPINRAVAQPPGSTTSKIPFFPDIDEQVATNLEATLSLSLSLSISFSVCCCRALKCLCKDLSYSYVRWTTDFKSKQLMSSSDRGDVIISLGLIMSSFICNIKRLKNTRKFSKLPNF